MKPGDFALGLRDFLAIIVPGALLLLLIPPSYTGGMLGHSLLANESITDTLLFLTASYAVGALIGAAAGFFDPIAERIYRPVGSIFTRGGRKEEQQQFANLRQTAKSLEQRILKRAGIEVAETALWNDKAFWRNYLRLSSRSAIEELDRVEGQQKLFRALALVFLIAAAFGATDWRGAIYVVLALLFFMLFVTYRRRFNARLFQLAIAHYAQSPTESASGD